MKTVGKRTLFSSRRFLICLWLLFICSVVHIFIYSNYVEENNLRKFLKNYFAKRFLIETFQFDLEPFQFELPADLSISQRAMLNIYEQQLGRISKIPILPIFENYRLKLRIDVKLVGQYLFGKNYGFDQSFRDLTINCFQPIRNSSKSKQIFTLTLRFEVQQIEGQSMKFFFDSANFNESILLLNFSPKITENYLVKQILVEVKQIYSVKDVFSFGYQWMDTIDHFNLYWPQWPIRRPCVKQVFDTIRHKTAKPERIQKLCTINRYLSHSTTEELFHNEQSAISQWLDVQYESNGLNTSSKYNDLWFLRYNGRRSTPSEAAATRSVCTTQFHKWISDYRKWHQNVTSFISDPTLNSKEKRDRIIDENFRFVLYENYKSSTADRLVHLITTYLIAMLTKRVFIFDENWPEFNEVIKSSLKYDRESILSWFTNMDTLNQEYSIQDRKYLSSKRYSLTSDLHLTNYDYDRQFPERILIFHGKTGATVQAIMSNNSIHRLFLVNNLRMNPNKLFGCLYHSLIMYPLSSLIEVTSTNTISLRSSFTGYHPRELIQILLSPRFYSIGVEIHLGNLTINENLKKELTYDDRKNISDIATNFIQCADDIVLANLTTRRDIDEIPIKFLLSDKNFVRETILQVDKLPESCFNGSSNLCHSNQSRLWTVSNVEPFFEMAHTEDVVSSLRLELFDIFLFSLCQQHIITKESGSGRLGAFVSLKQRNIYSLSTFSNETCRNSEDSIPLFQSAYQRTGI